MEPNIGLVKPYEQHNARIATACEVLRAELRWIIVNRREGGGTGIGWGAEYNGLAADGDTLGDGVITKEEMQAWHAASDAILGVLDGAGAAIAYISQHDTSTQGA